MVIAALGKANVNAGQVRDILTTTAKPVALTSWESTPSGILDSVSKQGAGVVDVYEAVHHKTRVFPARLYLNDTKHANLRQTIELTNVGSTPQTYTLSHKAAGSLLSMDSTSKFWRSFPIPVDRQAASVTLSPPTLTLQPGAKGTVQLTFTPPTLNSGQIPIYSGWIGVNSKGDPDLGSASVPYLGVGTDLSQEPVLDTFSDVQGLEFPSMLDLDNKGIYNDSSVWTLQPKNGFFESPTMAARLRMGASYIRVDLVAANTTFQPTVPISDPHKSASPDEQAQSIGAQRLVRSAAAVADVPTIGFIGDGRFWARDSSRDFSVNFGLDATVLGGKDGNTVINVVDGKYRYLLRVSRLLQDDYSLEDSFESYLSHAFEVRRTKS